MATNKRGIEMYSVYSNGHCILYCASYEQAWDKLAELSSMGIYAYIEER